MNTQPNPLVQTQLALDAAAAARDAALVAEIDGGATYYPLWEWGTVYVVNVAAGKASVVDPTRFAGVGYIRLTGTSIQGTPAPQTTAVSIGIVARLI